PRAVPVRLRPARHHRHDRRRRLRGPQRRAAGLTPGRTGTGLGQGRPPGPPRIPGAVAMRRPAQVRLSQLTASGSFAACGTQRTLANDAENSPSVYTRNGVFTFSRSRPRDAKQAIGILTVAFSPTGRFVNRPVATTSAPHGQTQCTLITVRSAGGRCTIVSKTSAPSALW